MKKIILDTNVLISDPSAIFKFQDNHIIILSTVLMELDSIKDRRTKNGADREAREAIKHIESCITSCPPKDIQEGVPIKYPDSIKNKGGTISVLFHPAHVLNKKINESGLDDTPDSKIIAAALILQNIDPNTVLVSQDTNMRLIASAAGIEKVENYKNEDAINDLDFLPSGKLCLTTESWDTIEFENGIDEANGQYIAFKESYIEGDAYPGAYLFFKNNPKECIGCILKIENGQIKLRQINTKQIMNRKVFGITPKNLEQALLIDAILCGNTELVSVIGTAGTGKTLIITACLLELTIIEKRFSQIIICRTLVDLDKSIGALPGDTKQKVSPWMEGFNDAIKFIARNYQGENGKHNPKFNCPEYLIEASCTQYASISFLRGASPSNCILFLEEGQNTNRYVTKSLLTRITSDSMMITAGHVGQLDTNTSPLQCGLVHLVTTMKNFEYSKCIQLEQGHRSRLASYAETVM